MIATITAGFAGIADFARFLRDVWHDARAMQDEAEDRYGLLGF
jgi:hypothetical protein